MAGILAFKNQNKLLNTSCSAIPQTCYRQHVMHLQSVIRAGSIVGFEFQLASLAPVTGAWCCSVV